MTNNNEDIINLLKMSTALLLTRCDVEGIQTRNLLNFMNLPVVSKRQLVIDEIYPGYLTDQMRELHMSQQQRFSKKRMLALRMRNARRAKSAVKPEELEDLDEKEEPEAEEDLDEIEEPEAEEDLDEKEEPEELEEEDLDEKEEPEELEEEDLDEIEEPEAEEDLDEIEEPEELEEEDLDEIEEPEELEEEDLDEIEEPEAEEDLEEIEEPEAEEDLEEIEEPEAEEDLEEIEEHVNHQSPKMTGSPHRSRSPGRGGGGIGMGVEGLRTRYNVNKSIIDEFKKVVSTIVKSRKVGTSVKTTLSAVGSGFDKLVDLESRLLKHLAGLSTAIKKIETLEDKVSDFRNTSSDLKKLEALYESIKNADDIQINISRCLKRASVLFNGYIDLFLKQVAVRGSADVISAIMTECKVSRVDGITVVSRAWNKLLHKAA